MKDYLTLWADGLIKQNPLPLRKTITVTGERNQHLGPIWQKATVQLKVEPASSFEVIDAVPVDAELHSFGYPDWVVLGLLDVLMVAFSAPLKTLRVILEKAEYDPVDSSPAAFRQAGRDAGRKIIEALREP